MLRKKFFGVARLAIGDIGVAGLGVIDDLRFQNGDFGHPFFSYFDLCGKAHCTGRLPMPF